jgi:hypothetical protein
VDQDVAGTSDKLVECGDPHEDGRISPLLSCIKLSDLLLRRSAAGGETFDFPEPAFALSLRDSFGQVVANLDEPGSFRPGTR